jgi:hypothetical protein
VSLLIILLDPAIWRRRWLLRLSQRLLWRRWNEPADHRADRLGRLVGDGRRHDALSFCSEPGDLDEMPRRIRDANIATLSTGGIV